MSIPQLHSVTFLEAQTAQPVKGCVGTCSKGSSKQRISLIENQNKRGDVCSILNVAILRFSDVVAAAEKAPKLTLKQKLCYSLEKVKDQNDQPVWIGINKMSLLKRWGFKALPKVKEGEEIKKPMQEQFAKLQTSDQIRVEIQDLWKTIDHTKGPKGIKAEFKKAFADADIAEKNLPKVTVALNVFALQILGIVGKVFAKVKFAVNTLNKFNNFIVTQKEKQIWKFIPVTQNP